MIWMNNVHPDTTIPQFEAPLSSTTADFRDSTTNDKDLTVLYVQWLGDPVYADYHKQGNGDELENESNTSCHTAL
jgi:hypothetical protein